MDIFQQSGSNSLDWKIYWKPNLANQHLAVFPERRNMQEFNSLTTDCIFWSFRQRCLSKLVRKQQLARWNCRWSCAGYASQLIIIRFFWCCCSMFEWERCVRVARFQTIHHAGDVSTIPTYDTLVNVAHRLENLVISIISFPYFCFLVQKFSIFFFLLCIAFFSVVMIRQECFVRLDTGPFCHPFVQSSIIV